MVAITNLDHAKMLHLAKGEIVGFAHDEEVKMHYIETTGTLEIDEVKLTSPRNWIPERNWRKYRNDSEISSQSTEVLEVTQGRTESGEILPKQPDKYVEPSTINMESEISHKKTAKKKRAMCQF